MVEILLDFRKSVIDGNWNLHIAASERMLKWFFVCDRTNYARHFTFHWASQLNLSQSHLNMLKNLKKAILVSEGYPESSTASHQIKL